MKTTHTTAAAFFLFLISACANFYHTYQCVDVISLKINSDETVVISNGKIINVDKSTSVKIPAHATVINGSGKYVIPGLVDAHVHFFQSDGLYARPDAIDLRKYHP